MPYSTRDTLMIRLPICWTQHQLLLFFRSWTTATLQLISLRKRKTMACFFFSKCIVWTEHDKSRPKFTSNLPTRDFCSTTTAMFTNMRYKRGLLKTMLDHAYRLSSCWSYFSVECDRLRRIFFLLKYPQRLIISTIRDFVASKAKDQPPKPAPAESPPVRVVSPAVQRPSFSRFSS